MMIRTLVLAIAAGTIFTGPSAQTDEAGGTAAVSSLPVEWSIRPAGRDGMVQLRLDYERRGQQNSNSRAVSLADLQGLSAAQLAGSGPASFRWTAEAGTLGCSGTFEAGRGLGRCDFRPDPRFAAELERRGIGRPSTEQLYQLALARVGVDLLNELDRGRYARPDVDDLVSAGIHGVTPDFVSGMAEAGYRVGSVGKLVEFRIHGVSPDYVRDLAAANPDLVRLHADRLVEMRIHGVSARFVQGMREAGLRDITPARLVEMRIHGVSPEFVSEMNRLGYTNLSVSQLVAMRIHGVSPAWVRQLHERGVRPQGGDELVSLRIHRGRFR